MMTRFLYIALLLLLVSTAGSNPLISPPRTTQGSSLVTPVEPTPVPLPSKPVAILTSPATARALGWRWKWEWSGAAHCLDQLGVDFEIISPAELKAWNGKLLILSNLRNMSAETVAEIQEKEVAVLATYMTSYRAEDNSSWDPNNFALAPLLGVDFVGWTSSQEQVDHLVLEILLGQKNVPLGRGLAMLVKPHKKSKVLARWPGGEAAIVESKRAIYVGEDLFCPENSDSRPVLMLLGQLMNRLSPKIASLPRGSTFSELPSPPVTPLISMGRTVRVGLGELESETLLRARETLLVNGKNKLKFHRWTKGTTVKVKGTPYLEVLRLRENGTYSWGAYRGTLEIDRQGKMVNIVDFEEYLAGVVPSEVPAYFPEESLKAMAVVARTYGLTHLRRHQDYDVCATVHCQVYQGLEQESPRTNRAVAETTGQQLVFGGKPINALFHAVCGGTTASPTEIWPSSAETPYLQSRSDENPRTHSGFCADAGRYRWSETFSESELVKKLREGLQAQLGVQFHGLSQLTSVKVLERTLSGRVKTLQIEGPEGVYRVNGDAIRWLFSRGLISTGGLQSTLFSIERVQKDYKFMGGGWGHGVGLCQHGASGRAKAGQSYREILGHYYTGATLATIDSVEAVKSMDTLPGNAP